ncbi:MAG: [Fe-Fe] hydrogenase large subunit C-terminal domain-containing protein [Myxococcota bacterium]
MKITDISLVYTIKDKCRTCFTCVRNCPAKAISIVDGQARVIPERCIGCGNCVKVCSQGAKQVVSYADEVMDLLHNSPNRKVALVAPSFPAEFYDMDYQNFVGMLKKLGFDYVVEVAFGADLVAARYKKLYEQECEQPLIESSCPAVVSYVEKYYPDLIENIAPLVSPMVAAAKAVEKLYPGKTDKVFIGPCIAKKGEIKLDFARNLIKSALTFAELRELFETCEIHPEDVKPVPFDQPQAAKGKIYPISHGFFQAAGIEEDLMKSDVISADGQRNFIEALKEFEKGVIDSKILELLCCQGCIMGAGISHDMPMYFRQAKVSSFAKEQKKNFDFELWQKNLAECQDLDFKVVYNKDDNRIDTPSESELEEILRAMGKNSPGDELNCGACGYETCREHAIAVYKGLAEAEMCLPYTVEQLQTTVVKLENSYKKLADTREALVHSEKLASMGQLAAGIAHEVNNPLGVILLYSHLLLEKQKELESRPELEMIVEQTNRCKKIVSGLLNFARQNKVTREPVEMPVLLDDVKKAVNLPENIELKIVNQLDDNLVEVDKDQLSQVFVNVIKNSVDAISGEGLIKIKIWEQDDEIQIEITDNGQGISRDNLKKVMNPFFTTKSIGKGTGLGLAVSYGIMKMHRGKISLDSNKDDGSGNGWTRVSLSFPRKEREDFFASDLGEFENKQLNEVK